MRLLSEFILQSPALLESLELADRIIQAQHHLRIALCSISDSDADGPLFHLLGAENCDLKPVSRLSSGSLEYIGVTLVAYRE